jgi:triphosphoribosyl-dephospho-CoA synthase
VEIASADVSLAESAVSALVQELEAYPKPGLVSPRDSGAHPDMDHALMSRSAKALFRPFALIAAAGREGRPFEGSLIPLGLAAEREMLCTTGGVNTHRGAIFTLGMLLAAMARAESSVRLTTPDEIRAALLETWGEALQAHAASDVSIASHGALVRKATGAGGARAEAARGFPGIFETGVPAYLEATASGLDRNAARIQTLFVLMESAEDSNVIFRGGINAAKFVRCSAAEFLAAGGCSSDGWFARAEGLHREFIRRNLSPGGCADLLSGTLLVAGIDPAPVFASN